MPKLTPSQFRTIARALVHDGIDARNLSQKAKQEIRDAFDVLLELAGK